jgi:hypothetical protein
MLALDDEVVNYEPLRIALLTCSNEGTPQRKIGDMICARLLKWANPTTSMKAKLFSILLIGGGLRDDDQDVQAAAIEGFFKFAGLDELPVDDEEILGGEV